MNLKDLADLVLVRNHIQFLINDRSLISKEKLRVVDAIRKNLDVKFLEEICKPSFSEFLIDVKLSVTLVKNVAKTTSSDDSFVQTNNGVVIVNPNKDEQLSLNFDAPKDPIKVDDNLLTSADKPAITKPATKSTKVDIVTSVEDEKEIAEKIAKAKKALKKKAVKPTAFKRDEDEVE